MTKIAVQSNFDLQFRIASSDKMKSVFHRLIKEQLFNGQATPHIASNYTIIITDPDTFLLANNMGASNPTPVPTFLYLWLNVFLIPFTFLSLLCYYKKQFKTEFFEERTPSSKKAFLIKSECAKNVLDRRKNFKEGFQFFSKRLVGAQSETKFDSQLVIQIYMNKFEYLKDKKKC